MWHIYDIEEIEIDSPVGKFDTTRYQILEIIESEYIDDEGNNALRIERYKRDNENSTWIIKDVWSAGFISHSAYKTEENIKYIKLIFPASEGKKWNGNAYNIIGEQEYKITEIDIPCSLTALSFDSVLTVIQLNDTSLIDKKYMVEKYAKNVGLIYKEIIDIYSNISLHNSSLPIEQRVDTGTFYKQELTDYGY
jgi:hypothetical protein